MGTSKSLALSDRMITNGMHAAMAMQTIFGSADAIIFWLSKEYVVSSINAARVIVGLCFWGYGLTKKRHDIGFLGLLVCAWIGMSAQTLASGGLQSVYLFWVTIFGPIIVMVGSRKLGFAISFASICWFLALGWLGAHGYITEVSSNPVSLMYSTIACMVVFLAMCYVVTNYQQSVLRTLDEEFERSKAIEINKRRFLTQINHEIRNPLSALLLSVDVLKKVKKQGSPDHDSIMQSIDITGNHILAILNGVLDSERTEHLEESVTEFDPIDVVKEAISILSAKASSSGVTLEVAPEPGIERHRNGNKVKLRQVLLNLVSNSIQHGGSNTTVHIKRNGEALTYQITDNGKGLSKQALQNIFKPFSASLGAIGTTGLGLSICKNLVEITMGGNISVSSNSTGTTFTVTVPFPIFKKSPTNKSASKTHQTKNAPFSALEGRSILIVEDDPFNNEMVSELLKDSKMCTTSAMDSSQALSQVQALGPFDFALVDSDLGCDSPLNGIEFTKLIAGQTIVIGFTGNHSRDLDRKWREAGASNILHKPVGIDGILTALRETGPKSLRTTPKKTPHNDKLTKASP